VKVGIRQKSQVIDLEILLEILTTMRKMELPYHQIKVRSRAHIISLIIDKFNVKVEYKLVSNDLIDLNCLGGN